MEGNKLLVNELVGKKILVKTHGGAGTKEYKVQVGEYKGTLLDFDGSFMKLEYEVSRFTGGETKVTNEILLLNAAYIITVEEYVEK
jgi:hypothetical protein